MPNHRHITLLILVLLLTTQMCSMAQSKLTPEEKEIAKCTGLPEDVLLLLKSRTGNPVRQLLAVNDKEETEVPYKGITSVHNNVEPDTRILLKALNASLKPRGLMAFFTQSYTTLEDEICIIRSRDPYEILRIKSTNGANFDIFTPDIIARLKSWEKQAGFTITGAGFDWVALEFTKLPTDLRSFVKDINTFCPDTVLQNFDTEEALLKNLKSTRMLFLWWD